MTIHSVFDKEFHQYGDVLEGIDCEELLSVLDATSPCPLDGTVYVAEDPTLERLSVSDVMRDRVFGGMPVQIGYCNGSNTMLNCLEYHRGSEINVSSDPFILLLASYTDIVDWKLDTRKVRAFLVPANTVVRVYETTLHYAPCNGKDGKFRVVVVLPKGTNTDKPSITKGNKEDELLFARNKWLLAHKNAPEAKKGAFVGLVGENISLA